MRTVYEYVVIGLPAAPYLRKGATESTTAQDLLNEWGELGWELVYVADNTAYLKRPRLKPTANVDVDVNVRVNGRGQVQGQMPNA